MSAKAMKGISFWMILFCIVGAIHAQNVKSVVVTGQGMGFEQAKNEALRTAVEQVVGTKIFSESAVKDFVAVKDVVITESFGLVTSYKVLERKKGKDFWEVKIRADVTKDVRSKWDKIKVILEQKGNPKIMFCIKESLDGQILNHPTGEYQLVQKFNELGFEVIDRQMSADTKELQKKIYSMDQNHQGIVAVSSKHGADLVVIGMLEGNFTKYQDWYGDVQQIIHTYHFRTKVIRTDTAQIIGSLTKDYRRMYDSVQYSRQSAGKAGFAAVIKSQYIQPMITNMVSSWIRDAMQGTSMTLVISNVKFKYRKKILEKLQSMPDLITKVQVEHYRNRRLTLRIKSKMNTESLAEKMEEIQGLPLEVVELKKNILEVKYAPEGR